MQYNKLYTLNILLIVAFLALSSTFVELKAQHFASKSLERNFELFDQHKGTDKQKALEYALLIHSDIDSTAMSLRIAEVYDFLAEHNETKLHKYQAALELRERSHNIYLKFHEAEAIVRSNADLSRLYLRNGDYHNAYSHSNEVLSRGREIGDSLSVREVYLVLEQVNYYYHHNYDSAIQYNKLVSDSFEGYDEARQAVRALNNRFNYDISSDEAHDIVKRTEQICRDYDINDLMINVYLNIAMFELENENFAKSAEHLQTSKSLISNFKEEGYYYSASGFYNLIVGNTPQAIADLKYSIELLDNGDFDSKNVHSYFLLQDIYRTEGRYREAYDALMAFSETYTRQHNTNNIIKLSLLINDMEKERAVEERRQLEQQHLIEQKHNKAITYTYILIILIILAIVALIYSRYRYELKNRELQRAQADQELNYKNEIIKIQRLQQYQERNSMEALSEELNRTANITDNKEMRTELRRVIRQLQQRGMDNDWADVEKTLASANDTLYANLLKEYPNLTKNERKLCTLIHMKLSTKEIANITHQSTGSINVARSRLRQKFGLTDSDISLISFLDKFKG